MCGLRQGRLGTIHGTRQSTSGNQDGFNWQFDRQIYPADHQSLRCSFHFHLRIFIWEVNVDCVHDFELLLVQSVWFVMMKGLHFLVSVSCCLIVHFSSYRKCFISLSTHAAFQNISHKYLDMILGLYITYCSKGDNGIWSRI